MSGDDGLEARLDHVRELLGDDIDERLEAKHRRHATELSSSIDVDELFDDFDVLKGKTFPTLLADPNWLYSQFGAKKHGAARSHYALSGIEAIKAIPVGRWARQDSILFLWATMPKLDQAIDVMRAWGFELVTSIPWVKTVPAKQELAKGIGFWVQSSAELLLVCRKGKAKAPAYGSLKKPDGLLVGGLAAYSRSRVFYSRRGAHSRKPLSLVEWIEGLFPGPLLELYARGNRPGWTCIGHQSGNDGGQHLCELGAIPLEKARELELVEKEEATS